VINIAVDTAYLFSQPNGQYAGQGIYMMDNNVLGNGPNAGEGSTELTTQVTVGFGLAFNVFPIDSLGAQGDSVEIVGIELSNGTNIFGNFGWPKPPNPASSYQWVGYVSKQGSCTYQLKIGVSIGGNPVQYYWWDPFLVANA
ncbi:MAG: hypothetical protein QOG84_317, partial [Sphingomonadales bacterium]|nr:hypothetical protein [Sphingomonadales bacterium]